jgi:chromosome segregation ATPase
MLRSAKRIKELEEQLRQCRSQKSRCDTRLRDATAQLNRTRSLRDGVSALHRAVSRRAQPQQVDTLRQLVGNHKQQIKVYQQLREGVRVNADHTKQLIERFDAVIERRRALLAQTTKPKDRQRLEVEIAATEAQRDVLMIQIASGRDELGVVKGAYGVLIDDLKAARDKPGCPPDEKRALTAAIDRLTAELARVTSTLARETQRLDVLSGMVGELEDLLNSATGADRDQLTSLLSEINDYRFDDGDTDTVVGGAPAWKRAALKAVPVLLAGAGIYSFQDRLAQLFKDDRGALAAAQKKIADLEAQLENLGKPSADNPPSPSSVKPPSPSSVKPPEQGTPTVSQVAKLKAQIKQLEADKTASAAASEEIAKLKAQLAAAEATAKEERAKAQEAYSQGQLPQGTGYVKAAAKEKGLESKLQKTERALELVRAQLASIDPQESRGHDKAALAAVQKELKSLRQAANAGKGEITALKAQVDNAAVEARDAAEEIAKLARSAVVDAKRNSELETEKQVLFNRVKALRQTVAEAKTFEQTAKEDLEQHLEEISKLKGQERVLKTQLGVALEKAEQSEADLTENTKEYETSLQGKENVIANLRSKLGKFEQNSAELSRQLDALIKLSQGSLDRMMQKLKQVVRDGTDSGPANISAYTKVAGLLLNQQRVYDGQIERMNERLGQANDALAACQMEKKTLMGEHAAVLQQEKTPGLLSSLFG